MSADTLIFLHIQKTGGTTLNELLERHVSADVRYTTFPFRNYRGGSLDQFRALSEQEKAQIGLLVGHQGFGLHEELPRPAKYISLLRDPVERMVSHYYHVKRSAEAGLSADIELGQLDFATFVQHFSAVDTDNIQTRMWAGNWDGRGHGVCDEAMLQMAIANIDQHALLTGTTEQFDLFYLALCRTMGWRPQLYVRRQVGGNRPKTIPADILQLIQRESQQDIALYQYVKTRFADQVAALGNQLQRDKRFYQARNIPYQTYWKVRTYSVRTMVRELLGK